MKTTLIKVRTTMCRLPRFNFHLEFFKRVFFISKGTIFYIVGQRYISPLKPQWTVLLILTESHVVSESFIRYCSIQKFHALS